jgi:hypothetical protein
MNNELAVGTQVYLIRNNNNKHDIVLAKVVAIRTNSVIDVAYLKGVSPDLIGFTSVAWHTKYWEPCGLCVNCPNRYMCLTS